VARLRGRVGGAVVLDAEGIVRFANGDRRTLERLRAAWRRDGEVVTAASALAEVLRGGPRDAKLHRVLKQIAVVPIDRELGRAAGELLGQAGLSWHEQALDALLAAVALSQPRPVVVLTSDPDDLRLLTDEPDRPRTERVAVIRV
jgi:predicted nucleic acid-binding protein